MSTSATVRRRYGRVAVGVLLLALGGCATAPKGEEPVRLVWPAPPLTARVEFVRSIVSDADLGRDTTFSQKLFAFLAGDKPAPNRIIEPMGLVISDDGQRLYVSDFARLEVFVFDFGQKTFSKIGEAEKLARPVGLALDAQEQLYVVEQEKRGISVFDRQGKRVRFFTHPSVERPTGIALDRQRGKVYLADTAHTKSDKHTIKIFNMAGELVGDVTVTLKAVYTDTHIYLLAQWPDKTETVEQHPYTFDGQKWGKPEEPLEDRFAIQWNISTADFERKGCAVLCHTGTRYPDKKPRMHTNAPGEFTDEWHWKGARSNPMGYVDDKYLDNAVKPDDDEVAHSADGGTRVYTGNRLKDGAPSF